MIEKKRKEERERIRKDKGEQWKDKRETEAWRKGGRKLYKIK